MSGDTKSPAPTEVPKEPQQQSPTEIKLPAAFIAAGRLENLLTEMKISKKEMAKAISILAASHGLRVVSNFAPAAQRSDKSSGASESSTRRPVSARTRTPQEKKIQGDLDLVKDEIKKAAVAKGAPLLKEDPLLIKRDGLLAQLKAARSDPSKKDH